MFVFIEGFQNVGKTTLINAAGYYDLRFGFVKYLDEFNLKERDSLNGFQIGKDLGMLFLSDFCYKTKNLVIDRGPLSTLYYSIKEKRWPSEEYVRSYLKEISSFKKARYIWVTKINDNTNHKRDRKDGFDFINDDEENYKYRIEQLKKYCKEYGIYFEVFVNDYSKSPKENAKRLRALIEGRKNEHN